MSITPDQAQMLTSLTLACRPTGAPRWDAPGVMAAIKRVSHLDLADVMRAASRAAEDRTAQTPAVIAALSSHHWRDRDRAAPPAREPYDASAYCGICSETRDRCQRKWAADHAFTPADRLRAETKRPAEATQAEVVKLKSRLRTDTQQLAEGASQCPATS